MKAIKIILVGLATFLCLVFLVFIVTAPAAKDLQKCFLAASVRYEQSTAEMRNNNWNKQQICLNGKSIQEEFNLCLESVLKKRGFLASLTLRIAGLITPSIREIERLGREHNVVCSEYPSTLIQKPN